MHKEHAESIDETAAAWVVKTERGLTDLEDLALRQWLADDIRHYGAYGRMQMLSQHTARAAALGGHYDPASFLPTVRMSRRRIMQGAIGGIASGAVAASGVAWLDRSPGHFSSGLGEVRVIALADGSVITLNTASAVSVRLGKAERSIELIRGEGLFDVAKEASRPFVVTAGAARVQVLGTSFAVRHLADDQIGVVVQEGVVALGHAGHDPVAATRLLANMSGLVTPYSPVVSEAIAPDELARELTWRVGRLTLIGASLEQAAAEFARYSRIRIVIDDPSLARAHISGSFSTNDPIAFSRAAAEALGARISMVDGEVHITS